ncbi:hypothetical protein CP533_1099 [Ophiocordyceps camponoti-saundersi (nom. inval.)]|nr:hypothetical protein CP533_1099 [Ophiocordyceps camponoti-saundersi (nom. inval.)]
MRLAACLLVSFVHGLYASTTFTFEEVSRCFPTSDNSRLSRTIQNFFRDASSCVSRVRVIDVLPCAEAHIPDDLNPLMLPMTDTIRAWEEYYGQTVNSAFHENQNPSGAHNRFNAWDELLSAWRKNEQLCYHYRHPRYMDHLIPQNAGLLNLFHINDDFQRPVLKSGTHWRFYGSSVCSSRNTLERARQESAVTQMVQRSIMWDKPRRGVELDRGYLHYLDHFSSDPFLQAVITSWQSLRLDGCPPGVQCEGNPEVGKRYLPLDGDDMLVKVKMTMKTRIQVCLMHEGAADTAGAFLIVSPDKY